MNHVFRYYRTIFHFWYTAYKFSEYWSFIAKISIRYNIRIHYIEDNLLSCIQGKGIFIYSFYNKYHCLPYMFPAGKHKAENRFCLWAFCGIFHNPLQDRADTYPTDDLHVHGDNCCGPECPFR